CCRYADLRTRRAHRRAAGPADPRRTRRGDFARGGVGLNAANSQMAEPASTGPAAAWSPEQYLKFEDERTRPSRDLLAQVPLDIARRVADLGCGPGNATELLVARFPHAEVVGVDSSPDMLRQARRRLPHCRFIEADLSTWTPEPGTDLLFGNAVFHWVPEHPKVLTRLLQA